MRRVCKAWLLPPLTALLIAAAPPASSPPPAWLKELMRQLAQIPRRETTFVETRQLAALDKPLVSHGRLIYVRPSFLQEIIEGPQPGWLTVDGDTVSVSENGQPPHRISLDSQPQVAGLVDSIRDALSGNMPHLEQSWHIDAEGSLAHWRLTLAPISPQVAHLVRAVTIEGNGTDITGIRVVAANGDEQRMRIGTAR